MQWRSLIQSPQQPFELQLLPLSRCQGRWPPHPRAHCTPPPLRLLCTHVCRALTCLSPPTVRPCPLPLYHLTVISSLSPPLSLSLSLSFSLTALGSIGVWRTGHALLTPTQQQHLQTCRTPRPPPRPPRPPSLLRAPASRPTWTNGRWLPVGFAIFAPV